MDQGAGLSIAKEYAAAVRKVMDATSIFLYGSYAKGTATKDSDIDIAVVVNQIPGDYLDTVSALWRLSRSISQEIEPVLLTPDDQESGLEDWDCRLSQSGSRFDRINPSSGQNRI